MKKQSLSQDAFASSFMILFLVISVTIILSPFLIPIILIIRHVGKKLWILLNKKIHKHEAKKCKYGIMPKKEFTKNYKKIYKELLEMVPKEELKDVRAASGMYRTEGFNILSGIGMYLREYGLVYCTEEIFNEY